MNINQVQDDLDNQVHLGRETIRNLVRYAGLMKYEYEQACKTIEELRAENQRLVMLVAQVAA